MPRARRSGRARVAAIVVPALVFLLGVVIFAKFFVPASASPPRADAIIVFDGGSGERSREAVRLARAGVAPVVVTDGVEIDPLFAPGAPRPPFELVRFPLQDNTRDEARVVAKLAHERGWRSVVLVTSTFHATRAGMLLRRCYRGRVATVAARPADRWLRSERENFPHELAGTLHALIVARGC